MDEELEELRRKKMAEIQRQKEYAEMEEERSREIEAQRAAILRQILTPQARERLGNLKVAYPEVARTVEDQLIMLLRNGRIDRQIDDATLKEILRRLAPKKREINIERK